MTSCILWGLLPSQCRFCEDLGFILGNGQNGRDVPLSSSQMDSKARESCLSIVRGSFPEAHCPAQLFIFSCQDQWGHSKHLPTTVTVPKCLEESSKENPWLEKKAYRHSLLAWQWGGHPRRGLQRPSGFSTRH